MKNYRQLLNPILFLMVIALVSIPVVAFAKPSVTTREITLHAQTFEYTPRTIRVNQGDRVKITLIADDVTHGLVIETYGVEIEAEPRQDPAPSVEFV
ncbi:MAG: hypothetical protein H8E29_02205, partial [Anaerolineales bacterium]|nr:hypothetical protein [Candidatus Desulfolinea nitratireducens]